MLEGGGRSRKGLTEENKSAKSSSILGSHFVVIYDR